MLGVSQWRWNDNGILYLGSGDDVSQSFDGTNFEIFAAAADTPMALGGTSYGFDLTYYFETAGTASFDYDGDDVTLSDAISLRLGDSQDIGMRFDGTDFVISTIASDEGFKVGSAADGFDLTYYWEDAGTITTDYDGDIMTFDGGDLRMNDDDILSFGDSGEATMQYDEDGDNDLQITGNTSFDNNVAVAGTVSVTGVSTLAGVNQAIVTVTDETPHSLSAANTGKVHVIPDMAANSTLNMPAEAAGLHYVFIYGGAADDAHDHTFDTGSDTNFFYGGVAFADTDAGDAADEINAGVYSDGDSNSKLTINNISIGTKIEFYCDGTHWYVTGVVYSDTVPSFADQS
jgi:hypothetical protein